MMGCSQQGPPTMYVEGIVTYQDAPVTDAAVGFSPTVAGQGLPATGRTDANGRFKLTATEGGGFGKGTTIGAYKVTVSKEAPVREPTAAELAAAAAPGGVAPAIPMKSFVPKQYNHPSTSNLSAEVAKGKNKYQFDLVD